MRLLRLDQFAGSYRTRTEWINILEDDAKKSSAKKFNINSESLTLKLENISLE